MICHLSGCKDFLKPQTVKLMHEPQFAEDARLGLQWTCGLFYATLPNAKEPFLLHFGGAYGFQSVVNISLSRGIGVFVAENGNGGRMFTLEDLLDCLSDKPKVEAARPAQHSITPAAVTGIKELAGKYAVGRMLSRGLKIPDADYVHVRYAEDIKGIEVESSQNKGAPRRLIEVEPGLFKSLDGADQVSFRKSKDGSKTYLFDYKFRGDGALTKIQ